MRRRRKLADKAEVSTPYCGDCGEPLFSTPSGPACKNGHGDPSVITASKAAALRTARANGADGAPEAERPHAAAEPERAPITLTVTAGQEVYRPIDYHSMVVGPLSMTVQLNGESPILVAETLGKMLEEQFEVEFQRKKAGMLRRMRELADEVRAQSGKRGRR